MMTYKVKGFLGDRASNVALLAMWFGGAELVFLCLNASFCGVFFESGTWDFAFLGAFNHLVSHAILGFWLWGLVFGDKPMEWGESCRRLAMDRNFRIYRNGLKMYACGWRERESFRMR